MKRKQKKGFVGWFRGIINADVEPTRRRSKQVEEPLPRLQGPTQGKVFRTQTRGIGDFNLEWSNWKVMRFPEEGGVFMDTTEMLNNPTFSNHRFETQSLDADTLPKGAMSQWVETINEFSIEYDTSSWCANCLVGPPRVYTQATNYGDISGAWTQPYGHMEKSWVIWEVSEAVYPVGMNIYETYNNGAVCKLEAYDQANRGWEVLWEGDAVAQPPQARIFSPRLNLIDFAAKRYRLTLDPSAIPGYNEIDCIAVIGFDEAHSALRRHCDGTAMSVKFSSDFRTFIGSVQEPGGTALLIRGATDDVKFPPTPPANVDVAKGKTTVRLSSPCDAVDSNPAANVTAGDSASWATTGAHPTIPGTWEIDLRVTVPISEIVLLNASLDGYSPVCERLSDIVVYILPRNTEDISQNDEFLFKSDVMNEGNRLKNPKQIIVSVEPPVYGSVVRVVRKTDPILSLGGCRIMTHDVAHGKPSRITGPIIPSSCAVDGDELTWTIGEGDKFINFDLDLSERMFVNSVLLGYRASTSASNTLRDVRVAIFESEPIGDGLDGAVHTSEVLNPDNTEDAPLELCVDLGSFPVEGQWIRIQRTAPEKASLELGFVRVFEAMPPAVDRKGKQEEGAHAPAQFVSAGTFKDRRVHGHTVAGDLSDAHMDLMTPAGIRGADLSELQKHVHEAASKKEFRKLAAMLASPTYADVDLNCRDSWQRTPLHVAVKRGDPSTAALLLSRGASPVALDRLKNTPLHTAAAFTPDKNGVNSAEIGLMLLSQPEIVRALREMDAVVLQNSMGETVWHLAARADNVELAAFFSHHPVLCSEKILSLRNSNGLLPQDVTSSPAMGRVLENAWRNAHQNMNSANDASASKDAFIKAVRKGDVRGVLRSRPLKCSLWVDKIEECSAERNPATSLIGYPRVFFLPANYGENQGAWAAPAESIAQEWVSWSIPTPVNVKAIEFYETHNPGAIIEVFAWDDDESSWVSLWSGEPCAAPAQARIFSPVIKDTGKTHSKFKFVQDCGSVNGYNEVDAIRVVGKEIGGPNDLYGERKETALMTAAAAGDARMTALLLSLNADPNIKDPFGFSPIHRAAMNNHFVVMRLLLAQAIVHEAIAASPDVTVNGETLLHSCARAGNAAMIKLVASFENFNADLTRPNNQGQIPRDLSTATTVRETFEDLASAKGIELPEVDAFPDMSVQVCAICLRSLPVGESMAHTCGCHAPYCSECFQHLITSCLHSGESPQCCNLECGEPIPWAIMCEAVPISDLLTLFSLRVNKTKSEQLPELHQHICGVCNRITDKSDAYDAPVPRFQCQNCNVQLCLICNNIFPFSLDEDDDKIPVDEQIHGRCLSRYKEARKWTLFQKMLDYTAERHCPICHKGGLKDDACTHMSCCQTWCFVCGRNDSHVSQTSVGEHGDSDITAWLETPNKCPMYIYPLSAADSRVAAVGCDNPRCQIDGSCPRNDCTREREVRASSTLVTMRVRYAILKYCQHVGKEKFKDILEQYDYKDFIDVNFFNGAFPWEGPAIPPYYQFDPEDCREFYKARECWFDFDIPDFEAQEKLSEMFKTKLPGAGFNPDMPFFDYSDYDYSE